MTPSDGNYASEGEGTQPMSLHDIAPRLAKARDQELAHRRRMRRAVVTMTDAMGQVARAQEQFGRATMSAADAVGRLSLTLGPPR